MLLDATVPIIVTGILVVCILLFLVVYYFAMIKQKTVFVDTESTVKCPESILHRYRLWYISYSVWTMISYGLPLLSALFSLASVYFAIGSVVKNSVSGSIMIVIFSLLTTLFTVFNHILFPKARANGFYEDGIALESGILKYQNGLIELPELCAIFDNAVKKSGVREIL